MSQDTPAERLARLEYAAHQEMKRQQNTGPGPITLIREPLDLPRTTMTPEQFCFWLKGVAELSHAIDLTPEFTRHILDLALRVTPTPGAKPSGCGCGGQR